jgi:hypothetical protein
VPRVTDSPGGDKRSPVACALQGHGHSGGGPRPDVSERETQRVLSANNKPPSGGVGLRDLPVEEQVVLVDRCDLQTVSELEVRIPSDFVHATTKWEALDHDWCTDSVLAKLVGIQPRACKPQPPFVVLLNFTILGFREVSCTPGTFVTMDVDKFVENPSIARSVEGDIRRVLPAPQSVFQDLDLSFSTVCIHVASDAQHDY